MARTQVSPVLVGRSREVDRLHEAVHTAAGGEGLFLLISGEAGLGKSRLLEEIERSLGQSWTILRGHCYEQEISFPYSPWIDALRRFFARRPPQESLQHSGALAPLAQFLPELHPLADIQSRPVQLEPQEEKRILFNAVLTLITQQSRLQPVLVEIEDLHWSDEASLDLLRYIVRHIPHAPVLIIATYRSDETHSAQALPALPAFLVEMQRERRAAEIQLAPLARPEVEQMARILLGLPPGSPVGGLAPVFDWMEGNPLYIEEIIQALVESAPHANPLEVWPPKDLARIEIPRSLKESVQGRAAGLGEAARRLLTLAAAIGRQVDGRLLEALAQLDEENFLQLMRALIEAQFLVELPGDIFAFRHALTREAIYSSLLGREKRLLHQRIAEMLETLLPSGSPRRPPELAYHFYAAASWTKAFAYARLAGEQAQAFYAPREAAIHFTRALEAARQLALPLPLDCVIGRAQAYELLGDFDPARQDYETALAFAQTGAGEPDHRAMQCRLLIRLGFLWLARDYRRSGEYFHQALELAQQQPDPAMLGHTLNRIGNWQMNQNRPFAARAYHEQALDIFERLEDLQGMGEALDLLGITHYLCGNMLQGAACFARAIRLWEQLGARQNLIQSLVHVNFPAVVDTEIEQPIDPLAQRGHGEMALRLAREMNWRSAEVEALATLANLAVVGEYARSLEDARAGLEIAASIDHQFGLAMFHSRFGENYLDLFDLPAARQALEQSLAIARASSAQLLVLRSTAMLARVYLQTGELASAAQLLDAAIPEWQAEQSVFVRQAWRARAELALAQGQPAEALHIIDRLIDQAENGPARGSRRVPALARLRGEALAALRRWPEAGEELQAAVALAGEHRRYPLLWRAQVSLGRFYLAQKQPAQAAEAFAGARAGIQQLAENVPQELRPQFLAVALSLIPASGRPPRAARPGGLTAREQEVVSLIGQGKSNRQIAAALVVGVRTVEAHITRILAKLHLTSRTEVAVWAVAHGLTPPTEVEK